jgi:hypothetical protein
MAVDRATDRGGVTDNLGELKAGEVNAAQGSCLLLRLPAESVLSI